MTNMRQIAQILATLILLLGLPGHDCDGHSAHFHVWRDIRESEQFIPHLSVAKTFKFSDDGVAVVSMTSFEDFNQLNIMKVCPVNACFNDGTCSVHNGQPTCKCREGTWGDNCEEGQLKTTTVPTTAGPTWPATGWAPWSEWGPCSTTCDVGRQSRTRVCLDVYPSTNCPGEFSEAKNCLSGGSCVPTAQERDFSQWGNWGYCSVTCGTGEEFRTRSCTKPGLSTAACHGSTQQAKLCYNPPCLPIDPKLGRPCEDMNGLERACWFWSSSGSCNNYAVVFQCPKSCGRCSTET